MERRYNCLTSGQRAAVEQMALRGCSNGEIADTLDIDKSKVAKIGARVRRQGHVGRPSRTGRPPFSDRRCLQRLKRLVRGGRYSSLRELTSAWNSGGYKQVSTKTLRRCIHKLGFASLKPVTKPYVGPINRGKRRRWAREHRGWSNEWNKVLFTDESSYEVRGVDKHKRVWRAKGERFLSECLAPSFKSGRETVMVWGGFCAAGRTKLVWVKGLITGASYAEMLLDFVYSEVQVLFGDIESCVLQEDLEHPYTAKVCRAVRKELGYGLLPWVPQSPDLNPIENAWDYLERAIRAMNPQPKTKEALFHALSDAGDNIPQSYFVSLVDSMPTRMVAVTKTRDFPTKY